ncbi:MAG TPA: hypothetical protein VK629_04300, partial [Steroidobacteraceae bacterium]|nr:hypothetical protein [Steroidobacteraceae bacterium]
MAATFILFSVDAQAAELVAAYSFDSVSGSTTPDVSGKGSSLTLANGAQTSTGRYALGMAFDGANDTLVAPNYNPLLNLTGGFTLSAWINPRSNNSWQMIINKPYTSQHSPPYFDWSMHRQS